MQREPVTVKKVRASSTTCDDDDAYCDSSGESANEEEWLLDTLRFLQRQKTFRRSGLHKVEKPGERTIFSEKK